jgi:hypothetical protein
MKVFTVAIVTKVRLREVELRGGFPVISSPQPQHSINQRTYMAYVCRFWIYSSGTEEYSFVIFLNTEEYKNKKKCTLLFYSISKLQHCEH